ncbi:oligosaccharide flippase family protein [Cytobacillus sp. FSL K6-0129]|uniref:oligosaccharide flippase family protein n=1 Tax=Cytobacillus sp. FSL K6-0129 TaxID=2921421 RepID=UPI0030FAEC07
MDSLGVLKSKFMKFSNKPFIRNVMIAVSGTAAAQVITMAFSPIITRIYGPEIYGILGVFMAMVGIISPIAALTYPVAIVLPKDDRDATLLVRISLYVSGIIALFSALVLVFFNKQIVSLFHIELISPFLFLIPLVILFSALLQIAQQWLIRTKQFRVIAKAALLNALIINATKVGFGFITPIAWILVFLSTMGNALHAFMLFLGVNSTLDKKTDKKPKELYNFKALKELAKKHIDFPLFRAPQVFINAISQSLPVLLLSSFFGPAAAGFYSIARNVLNIPIGLIGKSVGDVLYPRLTEAIHAGENIKSLLIKSTLALAAVGLVPFGIVVVFGPWLFGFVFGADWVLAGEYARWLSLWLYFMFINRPSVVAIPGLNLQGKYLIYEVSSILLKILALILGFYLFESNDILAVALYSIAGVFTYIYLIVWVIKSSK